MITQPQQIIKHIITYNSHLKLKKIHRTMMSNPNKPYNATLFITQIINKPNLIQYESLNQLKLILIQTFYNEKKIFRK